MQGFIRISLLFLVLTAMTCLGFNPPEDQAYGITLQVLEVPETVQSKEGLVFKVLATNESQHEASLLLSVYMNDDWSLQPQGNLGLVMLPAGKSREWTFRGISGERVLNALYPVHAFAKVAIPNQEIFELHPIAIFNATKKSTTVQKADTAVATTHGQDQLACLAASPIKLDGSLEEWWTQAIQVPCGADKQSFGKVKPESFDGIVMFLHDKDNIYIAGQISDDNISCTDTTSADYMSSDYLRLYFSAIPPAERKEEALTKDDIALAVNLFGGDKQTPLVKVPTYAKNKLPQGFEIKTKKTGMGYVFEAKLPKASLGKLDSGKLGMNLMIGDSDEGIRRSEVCLGKLVPNYWLHAGGFFTLNLGKQLGTLPQMDFTPEPIDIRVTPFKLHSSASRKIFYRDRSNNVIVMPRGFNGSDPATGLAYAAGRKNHAGATRDALVFHPPFRKGPGDLMATYQITLPKDKELIFKSFAAIRYSNPEIEQPSDGILFAVDITDQGKTTRAFEVFTKSHEWIPVEADLTSYAGKTIGLTLVMGPGPKGDTNCDEGFWGDPVVTLKTALEEATPQEKEQRAKQAIQLARQALKGNQVQGAFILKPKNGSPYAAVIAPGREGILDAAIAFSDGQRDLVYDGFNIDISSITIGNDAGEPPVKLVTIDGRHYRHLVETQEGPVPFTVTANVKGGVLLVTFSMPGVERDHRGLPRFTKLAIGPSQLRPWRVYGGFGNVLQDLDKPFTLHSGGFSLNTRHVGVDYKNGMSLAIASDFFPDRMDVVPDANLFTLVAHNDVTFYLAPSNQGAFAGAKEYGNIVGFKPSPGLPELYGRQCLDQWAGDYLRAADDAKMAAKFGLTHSIFVKHVWQRWGYDYRLPEIYPPAGIDGLENFKKLAYACQDNGILFAPHDNYIDFYPDAKGYSYDHIIFNTDGTPQKAWYNRGRKAQSYRWLPHAFKPWLVENMKLMKEGFGPKALFIDVFTAITPRDYYDRDGNLHTSKRMAREWADAFDTCRDILWKGKAVMTSECGHDGLIGSVDGGQSDHHSAKVWNVQTPSERVPWHDIVTHGKMILFAGGLGARYASGDDLKNAYYNTFNYLSNTVIGGRNPMSDGPFSRNAVETYWLLHDTCDWLSRNEFDSHQFGENIHQQHTVFGNGKGKVWTNRTDKPWTLPNGFVLPKYGLLAITPEATAAIVTKDNKTLIYSASKNIDYFDTKPPVTFFRRHAYLKAKPGMLRKINEFKYELDVAWDFEKPATLAKAHCFVHVCHPSARAQGEDILFHGSTLKSDLDCTKAGKYTSTIVVDIPTSVPEGELQILFGIYTPNDGARLPIYAAQSVGSRLYGGTIVVTKDADGKVATNIKVENEATTDDNPDKRPLTDFGKLATNGTFRLLKLGAKKWQLIPAPGSVPFKVTADAEKLFGKLPKSVKVEAIEPWHDKAEAPKFSYKDNQFTFTCDGQSFAYMITID